MVVPPSPDLTGAAVIPLRTATSPSSARLRSRLAVREFVAGTLALPDAVALAGVTPEEFAVLLDEIDDGPDGDERPGHRQGPSPAPPRISVVIPVFNEEANLAVLHSRLSEILGTLGQHEIIFVDDGSRDRSAHVALRLQDQDPSVRLVRFSRNFGHQAALSAGIDHARGDAVVCMDADLQDPPELLPELVRRWEDGNDVVYAIRQKRREGWFKRGTAAAFYRVLRTVADVDIPLDTGDFCLMDRKVADALRALPEKNRFLRGLRSWVGFQQVGVPFDRPNRHAGETKFTLRKMVKLAVDGVLAFTSLPLRMASVLGFLTAASGAAYLVFALAARFLTGHVASGWTTLVALTLIVGGAQLIMTGVLGAYIARIYEETKARPLYVVDEIFEPRGANRG